MSNEHWRRDKHSFVNTLALARDPLDGPKPLHGVPGAIVTTDPNHGAETTLIEPGPGWSHAFDGVEASLELFVMSGKVSVEGQEVGASGYVHLPQGCGGGELSTESGFVAYAFWNPNTPAFPPPHTTNRVTTLAAEPEIPTIRGGHGVWHKGLRIPDIHASLYPEPEFDGGPGGMLRVYFIGAGIDYPMEHSHMDCFEEIILIAGDCLLANEGLMGVGSVTTHPEEYWHGPFASRQGCLLLTNTDAPMGNPWPCRQYPGGYDFMDAYLEDEPWDSHTEHTQWADIELPAIQALHETAEFKTWWKQTGHEKFSNVVGRQMVSNYRASWTRDPEALVALYDSLEDTAIWRHRWLEALKDYAEPEA